MPVPVTHELCVVCAPDKFKGSLTALAAAQAIGAGIRAGNPAVRVEIVPIADGGDGTVDAAVSSGMAAVPVAVCGPTGEGVSASIAIRDERAIVELANCCGIALLPGGVLQPLSATTVGLGQAIAAALDAGCTDIVVGVGGSASTDVGLGALVGLGARLLDAGGHELPPSPRFHAAIATIDLDGLNPHIAAARFRVASDVDNPLLGARGAVAVFGPQKGVTPKIANAVEKGVAHVAALLEQTTGRPVFDVAGMGAAGGVSAALTTVLGAEMVSGADFVLDLLDLKRRMTGASLVVTGEGSFDEQTMHGKGPAAVLAEARRQRIPVAVVAGRITLTEQPLRDLGIARSWSLLDRVDEPRRAMRDAAALLHDVGVEIATWLAAPARYRESAGGDGAAVPKHKK